MPILHISGNRKLLESVIEDLWTMITEDHIVSNESYIQVANECKLQDPNGTVNNAVNDLAGCKAIYGDFRITAQTGSNAAYRQLFFSSLANGTYSNWTIKLHSRMS